MIRLAPDPKDATYLYLVGADVGPLKVGMTRNLVERFGALQKGSPLIISLIGVWRAHDWRLVAAAEYEVHAEMKDSHSHGEWFNLTEVEALSVINKHASRLSRMEPSQFSFLIEKRKPWDKRRAA